MMNKRTNSNLVSFFKLYLTLFCISCFLPDYLNFHRRLTWRAHSTRIYRQCEKRFITTQRVVEICFSVQMKRIFGNMYAKGRFVFRALYEYFNSLSFLFLCCMCVMFSFKLNSRTKSRRQCWMLEQQVVDIGNEKFDYLQMHYYYPFGYGP